MMTAPQTEKTLNPYDLFHSAILSVGMLADKNIKRTNFTENKIDGLNIEINDKNIILLQPARNYDGQDVRVPGSLPLPTLLDWINKREKDDDILYLIPLLESAETRNHWTLLVITGQQVYFFDPKGRIDSAGYDFELRNLETYLAVASYQFSAENARYMDIQPVTDHTRSGQYVCYLINDLLSQVMKRHQFDYKISPLDPLFFLELETISSRRSEDETRLPRGDSTYYRSTLQLLFSLKGALALPNREKPENKQEFKAR